MRPVAAVRPVAAMGRMGTVLRGEGRVVGVAHDLAIARILCPIDGPVFLRGQHSPRTPLVSGWRLAL
jgi:hypothetical protein